MQGKGKGIGACIRCMLLIEMTVQILTGILWMASNFTAVQEFAESESSIIYPILLKGVQGIGKLLPVPYYVFMYMLQLIVACWAARRLLRALGIAACHAWYILVLLTIPMVMQCHLALLPNSLALSAWLLFLAELIRAWGWAVQRVPAEGQRGHVEDQGMPVEDQGTSGGAALGVSIGAASGVSIGKKFGRACINGIFWWIVAVLLMPEYIWYGAAVMLLFLIICAVKCGRRSAGSQDREACVGKSRDRETCAEKLRRGRWLQCLFIPLVVTVALLAGQSVLTGRTYGELTSRAMVSRLGWPYFSQHFPTWSQEIWNAVGPKDAVWIDQYAENVEKDFFPAMEAFFDREQRQEYYWELARLAFTIHTKEIVIRIAQDLFGCSAAPLAMELQLSGGGYESFTGRNYDIMMQKTPELTVWYVRYGNWWFGVGILLSILYFVMEKIGGRNAKCGRSACASGGIMLAGAVAMVVIAALSGAGIMDYKRVIYVTLLWYLLMLKVLTQKNGENSADRSEKQEEGGRKDGCR